MDGEAAENIYAFVGLECLEELLVNMEQEKECLVIRRESRQTRCVYGSPLATGVVYRMPGQATATPRLKNSNMFVH